MSEHSGKTWNFSFERKPTQTLSLNDATGHLQYVYAFVAYP